MAKDRKGKLPKRVAGVKIPKDLRKKGDALIAKANSPAGREAIAAGLTMAAAAVSAAAAKSRLREETPSTPRPRADGPAETPQGIQTAPDPRAVAEAVGSVAEQVVAKLFGKAR